jgi:hypothetical protein
MRGPLFRWFALTALGAALPFIWSTPVAGQASKNRPVIAGCPSVSAKFHPCALEKAKTFSPPRMPDGTPNLQGIWDAPLAMGFQNIEDYPGNPAPGGFGPAVTGYRRSGRWESSVSAVGACAARREHHEVHRSVRAVPADRRAPADGELSNASDHAVGQSHFNRQRGGRPHLPRRPHGRTCAPQPDLQALDG